MMIDYTMDFLEQLTSDHNIKILETKQLKPDTPSSSNVKKRKVVLNMLTPNKNELPFQLAHEIAHILNNDSGILYFSSTSNHSKIETNANKLAIKILMKYYFAEIPEDECNVDNFMDYYCIPKYLRDYTISLCPQRQ